MPSAARMNDLHTCPITAPNTHVGGNIVASGTGNVLINDLPAAVATDTLICGAPGNIIMQGSTSVFIGKMPAARVGDPTSHGGQINAGSPNVNIGG